MRAQYSPASGQELLALLKEVPPEDIADSFASHEDMAVPISEVLLD